MTKLFTVLSDDTRRLLMSRLRERQPQSLSELAEGLDISRQAVTKHLAQLEAADLVRVKRHGRMRLHYLDPLPLREIEEWLAPYAAAWDRRLARLREHLRSDSEHSETLTDIPIDTRNDTDTEAPS